MLSCVVFSYGELCCAVLCRAVWSCVELLLQSIGKALMPRTGKMLLLMSRREQQNKLAADIDVFTRLTLG